MIFAVNKMNLLYNGLNMRMIWKNIKDIFHDANKIAFSLIAFRIVGKQLDELTGRAKFQIKAKRIGTVVLSTNEIIQSDRYLTGLSDTDRKTIFQQYQFELKQPIAFIESISIFPEKNKQYLIKIFIIEENKIICDSASGFLKNKSVIDLLSAKDVSQISKIYAMEKIVQDDFHFFNFDHDNVRYLK